MPDYLATALAPVVLKIQDLMNREHQSGPPSVSTNKPDALLRLRSRLRPTIVPRNHPSQPLAQPHREREKPNDCSVERNHPSEGSDPLQFADVRRGCIFP